MKTVMIVGSPDRGTREIWDALAPFCHPQICPNNEAQVRDMLHLLSPEAIVLLLTGDEGDPSDVFFLLEREANKPQLVAVGPVEVQSRLIRDRWLPRKHVVFLQSPVKPEDVAHCVKGSLSESAPAPAAPPKEEPPKDDGRRKILVVDDDPTILRLMNKMLSKRWAVTCVTSGPRAIVAVSKSKPDLILLDHDMPLVSGKMTLEILRSEMTTRDIPVVFLTGMSDPAHVEAILSLHPQGYLLKPPVEEKIVSKLESILGKD